MPAPRISPKDLDSKPTEEMDKRKLRTEDQAGEPLSEYLQGLQTLRKTDPGYRARLVERQKTRRALRKAGKNPSEERENIRLPVSERTLADVRFHLSRGRDAVYISAVLGRAIYQTREIINQIQNANS